MNGELHCLQRCFTDRCSACDVGLQGVVLNIAQCVIHTYSVLFWTLLSVWYTPTECCVQIAECMIHTYRVLYWTLLSLLYTPTGCCVEHRSACVIHTYRVLFWTLLSVRYTPTGCCVQIGECMIHTYSVLYCLLYTPTECCVEHRSACVILTYRVLFWTLLSVRYTPTGCCVQIAECMIHAFKVLYWTLLSLLYTPTGCCVEHCWVCDIHLIIIIIIIGTTARFEPWPSSEASASCPYSLQHSSSSPPPTSWHLPSHHLPILVSACSLYSSFYHCNENSSCRALFLHTNNMSCPF